MQEKALYTVVVADDEDELRQAVCSMIPWESLGFRLIGDACNGLDALELVEQLEPDLLLTDIRMPFISGIELARQVREIRPFMHIAFLSGFDDFEYAKQAIQYNIISYMLKPLTMDGLQKELTAIREKMDAQFRQFQEKAQTCFDRFVQSLLLDDCVDWTWSEADFLSAAEECGLLDGSEDRPRYTVMVTSITDEQDRVCTSAAQVHPVDLIAGKYLRCASFFSAGKVVTLLLGNASDFEEYLHILASEVIQMVQRVLGRRCNVGLSRETDRLRDVHRAYGAAMDTLHCCAVPGQSNLCFLSDVQPLTEAHVSGMSSLVEQAEQAVKGGSPAELRRALSQLFEAGRTASRGKPWLDMAALQLVAEIYRVVDLAMGSESLAELQSHGLPLNFSSRSVSDLEQSLLDFCLYAAEFLKSQQKRGGELLCQQALEAIAGQYTDESFSLSSLSAQLGVSPNHLSACIKRGAGDTFINILIQKRMDAARDLLLTTPMKILEIAQQCGYSDQHYFSYCFKKYCGITPNALRRQGAGGTP